MTPCESFLFSKNGSWILMQLVLITLLKEIIDELGLKQYNNGILKNQKSLKKIHSKIIPRQLRMRMIKKYLKKDIYLQKRENY